ncbi:uncharacterized protein LOC144159150 isoform X1 [Haemaphysalis longicornis]
MKAIFLFTTAVVLILAGCCHGQSSGGAAKKLIEEKIDAKFREPKFRVAYRRILRDYEHCLKPADGIEDQEFIRRMRLKMYNYISCIAEERGTHDKPDQEAALVGFCVVKNIQKERDDLDNKLSNDDKARIDSTLECVRAKIKNLFPEYDETSKYPQRLHYSRFS